MNPVDAIPAMPPEREKLTKKAVTADHPTWCPACGDFAVLASFYKVLRTKILLLLRESVVPPGFPTSSTRTARTLSMGERFR
jgi:pyruvate/2-oxoacid:ferredoxin oxidoreductase beta subunit